MISDIDEEEALETVWDVTSLVTGVKSFVGKMCEKASSLHRNNKSVYARRHCCEPGRLRR